MTELTISAVKPRAVLAPLARPITTAVASIEKAPLLLIDVETREGVVGHSYLFTYTPTVLAPLAALVANVGEMLIGKTVSPVDRFADLEGTFRLLGRQGLAAMAIAGLDMSFWDALGKASGMSVAELLGAENAPVRCYDSHGVFRADRDREMVARSVSDGFEAVKFKIGGGTLADDVDTLAQIREIIGPDTRLMVDYNQSLAAPEAVRRIRRLGDEFDLDWVEEPVPAEDYHGHRTVRAKVATPIQTGENWWLPDDAARAIDADIADHAMLDIMKIGGVTGWMRAASMAAAASLPVSSHIFVEASSHVLAASPGRHLLEFLDVAASVLKDPYEPQGGALTPRGPGFGVTWDEAAIARYSV